MSATPHPLKARTKIKERLDAAIVIAPEKMNGSPRSAVPKSAKPKPYSIVLARDFQVQADAAAYIKGVWHRDTLSVTYGPPGDGKTYVTADMALHVASGTPWCGRRVRRAGVIYLAAEMVTQLPHAGLSITSKLGGPRRSRAFRLRT